MLMGDGLRRNAGKFPLKTAAKDRFREINYADLNARVNQLAHGLLSLGVRRGDAVALSLGIASSIWKSCSPQRRSARWRFRSMLSGKRWNSPPS